MILSAIFIAIGFALTVYGPTMQLKKIGFIIQGIMHMKNSLAFLLTTELIPNKNLAISLTLLTLLDTFTIGGTCLLIKYVDRDVNNLLEVYFKVGCVCSILFAVLIPESPKWMLMKEPNSKEAIKTLNYISWFNGSKNRVPDNASLDIVNQVVRDEKQVNETVQGV